MTIPIIIICVLLLYAYVFDLTSSKTKIPSVILLLLLGWIARQLADLTNLQIPDLTPVLHASGTIGLILIVLEGSLELELNRDKSGIISKSFAVAFFPILALSFILTIAFHYLGHASYKDSLSNAVPLSIISSSVAIPSVKYLSTYYKEFMIYESSLSDILGILFFNFVTMNDGIGLHSFALMGLQLLIITVVSILGIVVLTFLLNKINHHIKFAPIILIVILIYSICTEFHLPGLIFIVLFGLFLGNLQELRQSWKWLEKIGPDELIKEVRKFKDITVEATFLVRALFFLLFGFLIETSEILNLSNLFWALGIIAAIYGVRALQLKISGLSFAPLLYIAPRGLITILLFLSIKPEEKIPLVNESLILQVILLSALIMMFGVMAGGHKKDQQQTIEDSI